MKLSLRRCRFTLGEFIFPWSFSPLNESIEELEGALQFSRSTLSFHRRTLKPRNDKTLAQGHRNLFLPQPVLDSMLSSCHAWVSIVLGMLYIPLQNWEAFFLLSFLSHSLYFFLSSPFLFSFFSGAADSCVPCGRNCFPACLTLDTGILTVCV